MFFHHCEDSKIYFSIKMSLLLLLNFFVFSLLYLIYEGVVYVLECKLVSEAVVSRV